MTGTLREMAGNHQSSARIFRRPTTRLPGSSSRISSTSRNGARCGMSYSITSRPNGATGTVTRRPLLEPLAQPVAATVRMTLGRPDRHAGGLGDLLERVAERVLEHHDSAPAAARRPRASRRARAGAGHAGRAHRIVLGPRAQVVREGLVQAHRATLGGVTARVDDEPVQPGGELRVAAELLQADAELGESLLRGVARVLGIAQEVPREALDLRARGARTTPRARAGRRPSRASPRWGR